MHNLAGNPESSLGSLESDSMIFRDLLCLVGGDSVVGKSEVCTELEVSVLIRGGNN